MTDSGLHGLLVYTETLPNHSIHNEWTSQPCGVPLILLTFHGHCRFDHATLAIISQHLPALFVADVLTVILTPLLLIFFGQLLLVLAAYVLFDILKEKYLTFLVMSAYSVRKFWHPRNVLSNVIFSYVQNHQFHPTCRPY